MSILNNILGNSYPLEAPSPPQMLSLLPVAVSQMIQNGTLPHLNVTTLVLTRGEVCHYVDKSCLVTKKVLKHYERKNNGVSIRVMKGVTYHTGGGHSHPIEQQIPVYTPGYLYITNKRIVFVAKENSFEKKLNNLTSITPYSDAIGLQFGSKTFNLLVPAADLAHKTLQLLTP